MSLEGVIGFFDFNSMFWLNLIRLMKSIMIEDSRLNLNKFIDGTKNYKSWKIKFQKTKSDQL
jgi:hypothetical protein